MTYNFQTENKQNKTATEYETETQKVDLTLLYSLHWYLGENMM
jgi:hypothetical protein